MASRKMPTVFVPHGGGPWPFVDFGLPAHETEALLGYLRTLPAFAPKAMLVISAHWEAAVPTVMSAERPSLLFDYYGFPPQSYQLRWPAPGSPALAARVGALLDAAGIEHARDAERGFDHGAFVPLKVAFPEPSVPTVQLSLKAGLDPREHLAIGRALAPLRDEGVLIVGSGMSYHNMRGFREGGGRNVSETFDAWLQRAAQLPEEERARALASWAEAPAARSAHPREEHLMPLMVVAGAAGADLGSVAYSDTFFGVRVSAFEYGAART